MGANDTVFDASLLSSTFNFFTSTLLELVFFLIFLEIFPEPEHSPLLFLADCYCYKVHCNFDTSHSDLCINIEVHNQDGSASSSLTSLTGRVEIRLKT